MRFLTKEVERPGAIPGEPIPQKPRRRFWTRRVDQPTYVRDIVGSVERFDQRDILRNRHLLQPGSPEYRAYYALHPEWEEKDTRLRSLYPSEAESEKRRAAFAEEPLALALSNSIDYAPPFARPELADGPVSPYKVELDPARANSVIKGLARWLGADLVGICRLNPWWIYSYAARGPGRWGKPIEVSHKYAISIAVASDWNSILAGRGGKSLCGSYMTHHYVTGPLIVIACRIAAFIRALGYPATAQTGDGTLLDQAIAVDAGLGEMGRSGLIVTKEFGTAVHLRTVTTDLPVAVDKPVDYGIQDFCARCFKCAEVCPVNAVPTGDKEVVRGIRMWTIDAEKCFMLRRAHGNVACMSCLATCEFTEPRNIVHRTAAELAVWGGAPGRSFLVWLYDKLYGKVPRTHRYPDWLEFKGPPGLRERISTFLHKV
ncbi:MAG: hypothetical protein HYY45_06580 [Deltaproteobacteria bacterium]|nr:hypothetical protein [Deltaproteobacteria bacterium]